MDEGLLGVDGPPVTLDCFIGGVAVPCLVLVPSISLPSLDDRR